MIWWLTDNKRPVNSFITFSFGIILQLQCMRTKNWDKITDTCLVIAKFMFSIQLYCMLPINWFNAIFYLSISLTGFSFHASPDQTKPNQYKSSQVWWAWHDPTSTTIIYRLPSNNLIISIERKKLNWLSNEYFSYEIIDKKETPLKK